MPDLPKDILSRIFGIVNRLDIYLFFSEYIYPIDINIDCLLYARQELLIKRSYRHVIKLLSMKDAMQILENRRNRKLCVKNTTFWFNFINSLYGPYRAREGFRINRQPSK